VSPKATYFDVDPVFDFLKQRAGLHAFQGRFANGTETLARC